MKYIVLLICATFCLSVSAEIEPSDSYLDFWDVVIGDSETLDFELVNGHPFAVEIWNVDINGDFGAFDINEDCLGVLYPGENCYVEVTFTPDEVERYWGAVEVETSTREWIQIDLQGDGVRW